MGDFKLIALVISNGDRNNVVNASIKTSYLELRFTVLNLTVNMRLSQQLQDRDSQQQKECLFLQFEKDII